MSQFRQIYRYLIALVLYLLGKLLFPVSVRLAHYEKSVMGTCTIWAPQRQMQIILEGLLLLRNIDSEMYKRLTDERKYTFWYHKKIRTGAFESYSMTDAYLRHGKEGVVICLVQTVLDRTMKDSLGRFRAKTSDMMSARRENKHRLVEFIRSHSFSQELVTKYQKFAEKY